MDETRIKKDLHDIGYSVMPFPKKIKDSMIEFIKEYLSEVAMRYGNATRKENNIYQQSNTIILNMSDTDYHSNFSKPFRMFPDKISKLILDWIKSELCRILSVNEIDSNYVSPSERKINQKLTPTTYDIFWRCVRRNRNDVGPAHCDYQFWELAKGTEDEVPVPFAYRERWKIWVPLLDCVKENMLQMIPSSHKEQVPMLITETPFGKRPWLDEDWYEKNKKRFIAPDANLDEDCIIFHDRLIHRGPKNTYSDLRISSELTVLVA